MNVAKQYYVYLLVDPQSNLPFYVGKGCGYRAWHHTKVVQSWIRVGCPTDHYFFCANKHKAYKIRKILEAGHEPVVEILMETESEGEALRFEAEKIAEVGLENLTNIQPDGKYSEVSEETRERMSEAHKKRWADPGFRDRMKETHRARFDDEMRVHLSECQKRAWADPEYRERRAALPRPAITLPGHVISKETRRKIGEANSNPSDETRAKMSKSQRERVRTPEDRNRQSELAKAIHTGRKRSAETKRRMSEAMKASHARRKAEKAEGAAA